MTATSTWPTGATIASRSTTRPASIVQSVRGEATLSKWAEEFLNANPLDRAAREESDLEPDLDFFDEHDESAHVEKYFWAPSWVSIHDGRLYVVDSNRHRLQLYDRGYRYVGAG